MDVSPALKAYAEQKANKLVKYYNRIAGIEVVFEAANDRVGGISVEMIVDAERTREFVAHHNEGDAYAGVDGCFDKLERQLHEHKDQHRNRKHMGGEDKHAKEEESPVR